MKNLINWLAYTVLIMLTTFVLTFVFYEQIYNFIISVFTLKQ